VLGIVLASLLINFSLFFTKILIDASNIVTIGVYRSILSTPVTPPQPGQPPTANSIATILLSKLKLQTIYSTSNPDLSTNGVGGALIFLIGSSIIFLVSTFVMFAITANFIIRYITLIILLVLSPIAYMGIALSGVKKYQNDWWDSLRGQLIFAPVFMIMLMIVIQLISSPGFVSQGTFADLFLRTNINPNANTANAGGATAGTGAAGLVLNFAVVIGLLIATLTVSKGLAKKGSSHIGDATSKLTGYAGGMFMGGAARLGRGTIGRWGNNTANDEDLKDRAAKGDIRARLKLSTANRLATSSFDTRATDTFGALAKAGGVGGDFGKVDPKKTNFRAIMDAKAKEQEELVKRYEPSKLEVERVKGILDSNEFKAQEEKEKEEHLNSDEFKNSDIYKNAQKAEEENKQLEELTKKDVANIAKLKQLEESKIQLFGQEEIARKAEIENLRKQIEDDKKIANSLKENSGERSKIIETRKEYEKLWMSDTQKDLIARKGGQEEKKKDGKIIQNAIEGTYQTRAKNIASRYENEGILGRYSSTISRISKGAIGGGILGGIPGAIIGGAYAYGSDGTVSATKTSRSEIARRMRAVAKAKKSTKEQLEDILKDSGEISKDEEKAKDDKPKDESEPKTA
jgi:hypothetical protein